MIDSGRLWSLHDMLKFYADKFAQLATTLAKIERLIAPGAIINDQAKQQEQVVLIKRYLSETAVPLLDSIGLGFSRKKRKKLLLDLRVSARLGCLRTSLFWKNELPTNWRMVIFFF